MNSLHVGLQGRIVHKSGLNNENIENEKKKHLKIEHKRFHI